MTADYGCDETYERASKGAQRKGQWCACGHRAGYHDEVWATVKAVHVPVGLGACSCPGCECGEYQQREGDR